MRDQSMPFRGIMISWLMDMKTEVNMEAREQCMIVGIISIQVAGI